ncbi:hypothetical protein SAMN05216548_10728 [Faunimonas pinastri]|uniref:Uncharacterized protein n=1 Tax=Faunimonas pinastri TaxID=1855383 RepID=A0A1H9I9M1_9HYPH|nr:hypothetical protein [Faunimonas pinastri]SEQ71250.1 hypothetical protein SAMN05216548_10728 [Faunimonas pinastri]
MTAALLSRPAMRRAFMVLDTGINSAVAEIERTRVAGMLLETGIVQRPISSNGGLSCLPSSTPAITPSPRQQVGTDKGGKCA